MRARRAKSSDGRRSRARHVRVGLVLAPVLILCAYGASSALRSAGDRSDGPLRGQSDPPARSGAQGVLGPISPVIIGTPRVGRTLTVGLRRRGRAVGGAYRYRWRACDPAGGSCTAIAGATGRSYSPTATQMGEALEVLVRVRGGAGSAVARSPLTHVVIGARNAYVAQTVRGGGGGSSCANARSAAWLDAPAHWGAGRGRVRAGTMVHLCGTISTPLRVHASGTGAAPIMLYFQPGARIAMPVCPGREAGCIDTDGHSHISIDGGLDGSIANTQDGTTLAQQQGNSYGIEASDCNGCRIENLTIANLYVHTGTADTAIDAGENEGINFSGSDLVIAHNTLHDIGWALVAEWGEHDKGVSIAHNDVYRIDHGLASTAAFSGGSIGPIYIDRNHFHDYANWDTTTDAYHHDGIHCFSADAVGYTPHYNGLYIYDNRFGGATGNDMTAQIFIEGGSGGASTPCADPTSNIWIFGNLGSASTPLANGIFGIYSGAPHIFNNTLIGAGTSEGACYRSLPPAANERFENNLLSSCNALIVSAPHLYRRLDHNLYARGGGNAFVCGNAYYAFGKLARWRVCMGADRHSRRVPGALLGADGLPRAGSRVGAAGVNLTRLCAGATAALCRTIGGQPRRRHGAWSIGAE